MSFLYGQKLNECSPTEAEIIGIDNATPDIMWGKNFIEAQDYTMTQNILYKDNKYTIIFHD